MKRIKIVPNTIKVFVNIFDGAHEISLLFHSEFGSTDSCYDLVKQLSHYLYFFSISFLFFYYIGRSVGKYHVISIT